MAQSSPSSVHGSVTALLLATLDRLAMGERPKTEEAVRASYAGGDSPHRSLNAGPQTAGAAGAAGRPRGTGATLGDLIEAMDERAFGLLLLILALPCCIPFLWGIPQIVALPMLAIAGQLAAGRHAPWLPARLRNRPMDIDGMREVVRRASRYLGWLERLARPRLTFLTDGTGARFVGLLLLIPTASILVPLPSTNTAPGIGVAIASVGLLERDGLLVLGGLLFGLAWVALLVFAAIFFGAEATDLIRNVIRGGDGT